MDKNRKKMYLAVGTIMIIIVTAWILNLKNSLTLNDEQKNPESQEWQEISSSLNQLLSNVKDLRQNISQSPTSTAADLQPAALITPQDLNAVIEKLKIATTTTSTNGLNL